MAARAVRSTGSLQAAAAAALAGPSAASKAPSRVRPPIAPAAQTLGRRGGGSADRSAADRSLLPLFEDDQGPYYAESESLQTFRDVINDGISGELALRLNAIDDQGKVILGGEDCGHRRFFKGVLRWDCSNTAATTVSRGKVQEAPAQAKGRTHRGGHPRSIVCF